MLLCPILVWPRPPPGMQHTFCTIRADTGIFGVTGSLNIQFYSNDDKFHSAYTFLLVQMGC